MLAWLEELERDFVAVVHPGTAVGAFFYAIVFLVIALLLVRSLQFTVLTLLRRDVQGRLDHTVLLYVKHLGRIVIILVAFILYAQLVPGLRALGTAMLAGVSVASIIFGLAAQTTLGNLIAGMSLLVYRPFRVGDRLQVVAPTGTERGVVTSITLGYSLLVTGDGRTVVLPNSIIANQTTINLTHADPRVRAELPVRVRAGDDYRGVRSELLSIAEASRHVVEAIDCPVTALGDDGVTLTLRTWCGSAVDAERFVFEALEELDVRLAERGIRVWSVAAPE